MENVKVTQLPAASVVSAPSDVLPLVHSGVTVKATPNQIVQEVLKNPGAIGAVVPSSGAFNALTLTGSLTAGGSPGTSGQILESTGTGVQWANAGSSMVYPGAGMAVSTGSAWGTSKVTPAGDVVGTTDTQTLTNKTANALTLTGTLTAGASVGTSGQVLSSTGTGVQWINGGGTMVYPGAGVAVSTGSAWTTSLTAPSGSLVGTTDTQTLTNKTISGASNTLSNIGNASLTNSSVTINGSAVSLGGSATVTANTTNALTIGTGLSGTSFNGGSAVTIAIDSTVATLTGSQTLTNKTISGSANTLSNIANASLTNSSITFGSTAQALGSTVSALSGVSISGAAGSFTTLSASSTVSGTGFSTYLASPPAIGGTAPAAGNFTSLGATGNVTLGDASGDTVAIQAGTAALPTLIPNGDTNTGLWFPAADTVAWSTAGTERLRITSAGNVGIGTNAPIGYGSPVLHINASGTTSEIKLTNATTGSGQADGLSIQCFDQNCYLWNLEAGFLSLGTSTTERLRIDSSGNVGIGTSTFGTSATTVFSIATGAAPTTGPADTVQFYSSDRSAGNTIPSFYCEGTGVVTANTTAAATHRIAIRINGTIYYFLANTSA